MNYRTLVTLSTSLTLLGAMGATAAADDSVAPKVVSDASAWTYRYELRALGSKAGEAVLFIGDETKIGKQTLRPVRIDARTEGFAASIMKTDTASTSWVDHVWLPVRGRWDITLDSVRRVYKTVFEGRRVKGTDTRDGKLFAKNDFRLRQRGADIVSIFPWIMHQDMSPGTTYAIELYDGRLVYDVEFTVGAASDIHLPLGIRKAIPLRGKVTRGKEYSRDVEVWVSAESDRTVYKLVFKYGLLGEVEAVLVGERKA